MELWPFRMVQHAAKKDLSGKRVVTCRGIQSDIYYWTPLLYLLYLCAYLSCILKQMLLLFQLDSCTASLDELGTERVATEGST
jgi:hypothetical protein